ncbi:MAG: winged helix DNA-binding domain-containing protein [Solirubrobacteraceae bacterium]|nr:winged helix DNA-binding domain-containing protein [Solirubrobacteraceae bacterium]
MSPPRAAGSAAATDAEPITLAELNRATLARQHLLERTTDSLQAVTERLVGLQSQEPTTAYPGLWSRVEGFAFADLAAALEDRSVVRLLLMRSTVHLVTARDALGLRGPVQPPLDREYRSVRSKHLPGIDLVEAGALTLEALAEGPKKPKELGDRLAARWPDLPREHLAQLPRLHQSVVQLPPRGIWGVGGAVVYALLDEWLDAPEQPYPLEEIIRRYLAAFGPATVKDAQQWSGLTRLKPVFDTLGDELVCFTGPGGELLYDLPDAPRPPADTPAPVRLLPEWDNLLISHVDRTRVLAEDRRQAMVATTNCYGASALVDGMVAAHTKISAPRKKADHATFDVFPYEKLTKASASAIETEAHALLTAMGDGYAEGDVVIHPAGSGFPGYERPKR